jgi:hypothetical protein
MSSGPIRRLPRERAEDRSNACLPTAWFGADRPVARLGGGTALVPDAAVPAPLPSGTGPVLVMLASDHPGAMQALLRAADGGSRVYVLAPPGWGEGKSDPGLAARKNATVLVRRLPEVPVSGILGGGAAHLWIGASRGGPAPWRLHLDPAQAESFRQVFLRLFWHNAIDEAWTGQGALSFRAAGERPFDVPELPRHAPIRLVAPATTLETGRRGVVANLNSGEPPAEGPRRIWLAPAGVHHSRLARLHRAGGEVVGGRLDLPDIMADDRAGAVLLSGERGRLWIELTGAQVTEAQRILAAEPAWRFGIDLRIGDHANSREARFWLDGAVAAEPLDPEQHLKVGDVQADALKSTADTEPLTWPAAQPLALRAKFSWTAVPPRVPSGAEEEPLVGRWRKVDDDYVSRVSKVREDLAGAEGNRSRVGRAFTRLVSAMLGFERTQGTLNGEVSDLDRARPSAAGPVGAPALLQRLTAVEEQARKLHGDLEEAERKAREEDEREKQEREWKARVESARRDLAARKSNLAEREAKRPDIVGALATLDAELKAASEKEKKDLLARQKKLSDELVAVNRDVHRLKGEAADLEKSVAETFTFRPPAATGPKAGGSGARFVPGGAAARAPDVVPGESLPEVGALRTQKGQRYLVIDRWEDLFAGEQAATRLKARLVGPEGA